MIRKILYYLFLTLSILLIAISLLSLIHNISFWFIQILDFPRLQYLVVGFICLAAMIATIRRWNWGNRLLVGGIIIAITIQMFIIFPYTKFSGKEVATVKKSQVDTERNSIKLMVANVWLKNDNYAAFLKMAEKNQADIIMTLEVNNEWLEEIKSLENIYNHTVKKPFDNTYGMALYSKYPLKDTKIRYLKHEEVPSIHTKVQMPDKIFNLHVVHPVPPKPSEHPDNVGEKEIALVKVGNMVSEEKLPAVIAGDFNDVAWSKYSRLFKENGQLNDIRVGRGFYNTFDATSGIMRWPLDHVYVTSEFEVMEVKRLEEFGSDHFPLFVKLYLP